MSFFWLILVVFIVRLVTCAVDLTVVDGSNGLLVVTSVIARIADAGIFSQDYQMLRRIAYVETRDGLDYTNAVTNGGIWQLSYEKYDSTRRIPVMLLDAIYDKLHINWTSTTYHDLRKPLHSALAARLFLEVLNVPLTDFISVNDQANIWVNNYTSSPLLMASDFIMAVDVLQDELDQNCDKVNLMFLIDESSSVGPPNFELMKQFVYDVVNGLIIGPDNALVGVYKYASSVTKVFNLTTYTTKPQLLNAINDTEYQPGGFTFTHRGLQAILDDGFHDARPPELAVPRVLVLITDGRSTSPSNTQTAAGQIHDAGIITFAVGIASADIDELNTIASKPSNAFFYPLFTDISSLQDQLRQHICTGSPSIPNVVMDTIGPNATKYGSYSFNGTTDFTIKLQSDGNCTLYGSSVIQTPNEVIYEVKVSTTDRVQYGDVYVPVGGPDILYVSVECDTDSNVILTLDNGDTTIDPVVVVIEPSSVTEYYGVPFTVTCKASGYPIRNITWYTPDGGLVTSSDRFSINETLHNTTRNSVLTVSEWSASDEGMYTCTGTISNGSIVLSENSATLSVTGDSFCVSHHGYLDGYLVNDTSVILSWTVPPLLLGHSNIAITHYEVNYTGHTITEDGYIAHRPVDVIVINTDTNSTVVTDLYPGYIYEFKVRIKYEIADVDTNTVIVFTSLPEPMPRPDSPVNVIAEFISNDTVIISWDESDDTDYYEITYTGMTFTPNISMDDELYVRVVNSSELTVFGLLNDYYYQFEIRGRNQYGYGGNTTLMVLMPPAAGPSSDTSRPFPGSGDECTDELIPAIVVPVVLFIALVIMIISVLLYCLKRQCQTYNITSDNNSTNSDDVVKVKEITKKTSTLEVELNDFADADDSNEEKPQASDPHYVEISNISDEGKDKPESSTEGDTTKTTEVPNNDEAPNEASTSKKQQKPLVISGILMLPHTQHIRLDTEHMTTLEPPPHLYEEVTPPVIGTGENRFNPNLMDQIIPILKFEEGGYEL